MGEFGVPVEEIEEVGVVEGEVVGEMEVVVGVGVRVVVVVGVVVGVVIVIVIETAGGGAEVELEVEPEVLLVFPILLEVNKGEEGGD